MLLAFDPREMADYMRLANSVRNPPCHNETLPLTGRSLYKQLSPHWNISLAILDSWRTTFWGFCYFFKGHCCRKSANSSTNIRAGLVWASYLIKIPTLATYSFVKETLIPRNVLFSEVRKEKRKLDIIPFKDSSYSYSLLLDPEKSKGTALGGFKGPKIHQ